MLAATIIYVIVTAGALAVAITRLAAEEHQRNVEERAGGMPRLLMRRREHTSSYTPSATRSAFKTRGPTGSLSRTMDPRSHEGSASERTWRPTARRKLTSL